MITTKQNIGSNSVVTYPGEDFLKRYWKTTGSSEVPRGNSKHDLPVQLPLVPTCGRVNWLQCLGLALLHSNLVSTNYSRNWVDPQ